MEGVVTKEATTPFSKTERFLEEVPNIPTPEKEKVRKAIFENYVLKESLSSQFSKAKSRSERDVLKNVINNDIVKKYKLKTNFGYSCLGLKGRLRKQKGALETQKIKRIKEIQDFLRRDDNSRTTAGKRETKTFHKDKREIRYLQGSLEKLHKKYMEEGGLASYTTFTRYKPFYILDPKVTQRNTCACVKHANLTFLAQKLKILEPHPDSRREHPRTPEQRECDPSLARLVLALACSRIGGGILTRIKGCLGREKRRVSHSRSVSDQRMSDYRQVVCLCALSVATYVTISYCSEII
ncbi:hypothetical protein PYW08_006272 [Mythimna loreyi]|uniref:Uncharacterized protein n=1 Tax=Mythimna loreyi TaxID=667449 RepID=A0ACC2QM70_9NEOP|nr:hypothetical protein PYW08_006272 [Mythimna loreyi]